MDTLEQAAARRLMVLEQAYTLSGGSSSQEFRQSDLEAALSFPRSEIETLVADLVHRGLIEYFAMGDLLKLTREGVVEYDKAASQPDDPTPHFPAFNAVHLEYMGRTPVQAQALASGSDETLAPAQFRDLADAIEVLQAFVRNVSDGPVRTDMQADLDSAAAQLRTTTPDSLIIKESLRSLHRTAEDTGARQVADRVIAALKSAGWLT